MGAPVRYTCPSIDRLIEDIKGVMLQIQEDYPDEASTLDSIIDRRGSLEDLRGSNDALRTWGYEGETKVQELEKELDEANSKINDLQYQLDHME